MDNFDEFEFKPITEGLGFHKKTQKAKLDLSETLPNRSVPNAPPMTNLRGTGFRKISEERVTNPKPQSSLSRNAKPIPFQHGQDSDFTEQLQTFQKVEIPATVPSIFFDTIVVFGLSSLFLFATFLVAKVDPVTLLRMAPQDQMTLIGLVVLVFSVVQVYLLMARSFFGSTLGEWAFEVEVGTSEDQKKAWYPIRILLRSLVTTATGMIVLPIISLIAGKDLAGEISGAKLFRG